MAVVCHYCKEPASSSDLPCISCKSFYHHVCLFPASIISKSWTHINGPPPSYALAIFSSPNFTFTCPSCLLNTSSNTSTTFSSPLVTPTPIRPTSPPIRTPIPAQCHIPKLMELKTFPPSFSTANLPSSFPCLPFNKSYASAIRISSSPTPIQSPNVPLIPHSSTPSYNHPIPRKLLLNNILGNCSLVIKHLKQSDMNIDYISSILTHMLLPKISISIVTFKNHIAIIQFSNKTFRDKFFRRFSSFKSNPRFSHLYLRNSLPYKTRLLGKVLYHAYKLKMTPINTKPIFNTHTNLFEIRTISNYIDWSLPPITIPSILHTDWESSYIKYISSIPLSSNYSLNNNSDPQPTNPPENSNPPISDSSPSNPSSNTNSPTFVPSPSDPSSNTNSPTSDQPIIMSANINSSTSVSLHNSSSSNSVPDSQHIYSLSPPSHSPHDLSDNSTTST